MEPQIIQRFLESVGQKGDVDLYLRLFRAQKRESFALIAADARIVKTALDPFHFDLRILAGLGLTPVVLLGLFDPKDADRQAHRVRDWLEEDAVPSKVITLGPSLAADNVNEVRQAIAAGIIPLVLFEEPHAGSVETRFAELGLLTSALQSRKVVFLTTRLGLVRGGSTINTVNLGVDFDPLVASGALSRRQASLLRQTKLLLERAAHRMTVAMVNPLHLLRELFTVSGAGTLIRRSSRVLSVDSFDQIDRERLRGLIESAFDRKLRPDFFDRPVTRIYFEEQYLGAAVLGPTVVGTYLTKFAVERMAQGEGIGGDLWAAVIRDNPIFFWRSRPANPITPWYAKQCDGLVRFPEWHVFWRGLEPDAIPAAVAFAREAPPDLA